MDNCEMSKINDINIVANNDLYLSLFSRLCLIFCESVSIILNSPFFNFVNFNDKYEENTRLHLS